MAAVSLPEPRPGPQSHSARRRSDAKGFSQRPVRGLREIDLGLVALFLALTFLLGIFPLKDADYYWHLRTGDLIRQTGRIPRVDFYTFTKPGTPWIDLHWIFQVGISYLREHGGVPMLNLAKAVITCLAVLLLLLARRSSWPIWVMILAWLPGLLLLSGRMYIRPETLSLLYLAIDLAILFRWDRFPAFAWLLPLVQVAWVNSHGLFILGPVVLVFALVDALFRPGAFAPSRASWWRTIVPACVLTGLACLINPYGLRGALYPLELAGTMSNPIFRQSIAELTPIPLFIRQSGLGNVMLQLHLATMSLGALSFLVPICWLLWQRLRGDAAAPGASEPTDGLSSSRNLDAAVESQKSARSPRTRRKARNKESADLAVAEGGWRLSPFRVLLYLAFSALSLQATRNSHQFAAVVGTVTAWNFAEWAAALRRKPAIATRAAAAATRIEPSVLPGLKPRLITLVAVALVFLCVGSGTFYWLTGEGRTIGWGEEPLWFPHEAAKFAGTADMPDRFLSYHNAHASVFEYYHSPERENGPGRRVFTDPRLEIAGAELFDQYQTLGHNIQENKAGWEDELDRLGRPSILVDHQDNAGIGASLMASRHWKCVWFDPIVALFVHDSYGKVAKSKTVDFGARHFQPDPSAEPHGLHALLAEAKGLRNYVNFSIRVGDVGRPLFLLALDRARKIVATDPESADGWKTIGQLEVLRDPLHQPSPRFQMPFDPIFDLSLARATYAFRRAFEQTPRDFMTVMGLQQVYEARAMHEAELPMLERLVTLTTVNPLQRSHVTAAAATADVLRKRLGDPRPLVWKNLGELDQLVTDQLARGRAATAAAILEQAYPAEKAPWEILDRMATLHLHLGEPEKARELWRRASAVPNPAVRHARIAATFLAEEQLDAARKAYDQALAAHPGLFEALYGLTVVEQDAGRASAAYEQALAAIESAPSDLARASARAIASVVGPYARREGSRLITLGVTRPDDPR
jgi:tetratricopeptide (TPR) repeat protein